MIEQLKIQQIEEAIRLAHSRRSLLEILLRPVAFDSNNLDNKVKDSAVFRSTICSVSIIWRAVSGVLNVVNKGRSNT